MVSTALPCCNMASYLVFFGLHLVSIWHICQVGRNFACVQTFVQTHGRSVGDIVQA